MRTLLCPWFLFLLAFPWHRPVAAAEPSPPVSVLPAGFDGRQPQLAADFRDRSVYLVVGKTDGGIFCARSVDGGGSFSAPVKVAALPVLTLGLRRGPRIAADGGQVTITVVSQETGQLLAYRSADRGQTWSAPVCINQGAGKSAEEGLHALVIRPRDGLLYAVWLDNRVGGETAIYGSSSADHGTTWSANRPVYHSPDKHVCECCHPSAVFDANGTLTVMWRNWLGGSRDLYTADSRDGGQTFGPAVKQGPGTWKLNACPMDGGAVAALSGNGVATVWQRAGSVYLARANGGAPADEMLIARGMQPTMVGAADGAVVTVWQNKAGEIFAARIAAGAGAVAAPWRMAGPGCGYVSLVNLPLDSTPVAAWEATDMHGDKQVFVARVR